MLESQILNAKLLSTSGKVYTSHELEQIRKGSKGWRAQSFYHIKVTHTERVSRPQYMLVIHLPRVGQYFFNEDRAIQELTRVYQASFGLLDGDAIKLYFEDEVELDTLKTASVIKKHKLQGYVSNELVKSDL